MTDEPIFGADDLVQSLRTSLQNREHSIKAFPGLLRRTIETGAWQSFRTPLGESVEHKRFIEFITKEPFDGLGITVKYARQIVGDDYKASVALRDALKGKRGPQREGFRNIVTETKTGNSRSYTLDRLSRERPDLRARVDARELTPNAAAIEAGFRKKTFTVRTDDPDSIAATLKRQLAPDILRDVAKLLSEEEA